MLVLICAAADVRAQCVCQRGALGVSVTLCSHMVQAAFASQSLDEGEKVKVENSAIEHVTGKWATTGDWSGLFKSRKTTEQKLEVSNV